MSRPHIIRDFEDKKQPRKDNKKISTIRKMNLIDIIESIVTLTSDMPIETKGSASKYITVLSERLNVSPMQALLFAIFIKNHDDCCISYRDICNHFDCNHLEILKYSNDINELVKLGLIVSKRDSENHIFRVPKGTITNICNNVVPKKICFGNLTPDAWLDTLTEEFCRFENDELEDADFEEFIHDLFSENQHLNCVQKIQALKLDLIDLKLFLAMSLHAINNNDDQIRVYDIDDYYQKREIRRVRRRLESNEGPLFELKLIENACEDGRANASEWRLTDTCKEEIYPEFKLIKPQTDSNLTLLAKDISEKTLYYNDEITKQIDTLHSLLTPERMTSILNKLEEKGQRKGFACLFYGTPGTGKTETVMQLARQTGRDIMQVNIASIRSKWVGETEQNMKDVFDRYKKLAHDSEKAPILLFNEADALFMTRVENAEHSVDKMENAMQNIILQEMESLEGILIATTNLTGSLDPAFERRFLYKIEFTKPEPEERKHIWKAMIPELSDSDALSLAEAFDFSGGQIENIARKRMITDILNGRDQLDMNEIVESCRNETLSKKKFKRIGFTV